MRNLEECLSMSRKMSQSVLLGMLLTAGLPSAYAETLTPLQGQSPEAVQSDVTACQGQAAGSPSSTQSSTPSGGRLRGAAVGAAAGAAAAQVRGNQHEEIYDRVDDDVKQEYRQNQARQTAAVGAAVGASKQRREGRAERNQASTTQATNSQAYIDCMTGKGYSVTP
jgi:hypothetical protein